MRNAWCLIAIGGVAMLGGGLVACGSDDKDKDGSTATTSSPAGEGRPSPGDGSPGSAEPSSTPGTSSEAERTSEGEGGGESGPGAKSGQDREAVSLRAIKRSEAREARKFVPKRHNDSGGGTKQFVVQQGDNSVQEFGSEGTDSELEEAAAALHNFFDARAEGNWAATCLYMSSDLIESLETQTKWKGCASVVEGMTGPVRDSALKAEAAAINVGALRTDGKQGFLLYRGPENVPHAMTMVKENGAWKVRLYAGYPME